MAALCRLRHLLVRGTLRALPRSQPRSPRRWLARLCRSAFVPHTRERGPRRPTQARIPATAASWLRRAANLPTLAAPHRTGPRAFPPLCKGLTVNIPDVEVCVHLGRRTSRITGSVLTTDPMADITPRYDTAWFVSTGIVRSVIGPGADLRTLPAAEIVAATMTRSWLTAMAAGPYGLLRVALRASRITRGWRRV